MKKINNKGFTLIELLAVIVILAIVLVVTVPSVINAMNAARQNAYEESLTIIERYVDGEREKCLYGLGEVTEYNEDILNDNCDLIGTNEEDDAETVSEISDIILDITGYANEIESVIFYFNDENDKYEIMHAPVTIDGRFKGVEERKLEIQEIDSSFPGIGGGGGGLQPIPGHQS